MTAELSTSLLDASVDGGLGSTETIVLQEPELSVSVSPLALVADGGDVAEFVIVLNATQGATFSPAYVARVRDLTLPGRDYVVEEVRVDGVTTYQSGVSASVSGHGSDGEWAVLPVVSDSSVLVYRVRLTDEVSSSDDIVPAVRVQYSSHPGSEYGGGRNYSEAASSDPVVSVPGPSMVLTTATDTATVVDTDIVAGQTVLATVSLSVAEGTLYGASLSVSVSRPDVVSVQRVVSVSPSSGSGGVLSGTLSNGTRVPLGALVSGSVVDSVSGVATIALGDVRNSGVDDGVTVERVEAVVELLVRDDRDVVVRGASSLVYANLSAPSLDASEEPEQSVLLTVRQSQLVPAEVSPVLFGNTDAGDIVTFTMLVRHAGVSDADAFNVTVRDLGLRTGKYVVHRVQFNGSEVAEWGSGGVGVVDGSV